MKYYLDITLLPDIEIPLGFIWQKVFQQVHIALADNKVGENESDIALSLPNYGDKAFPLGNKLRLFSVSEQALERLAITKWLKRFTDHTHITSVKAVPESANEYACFTRKQFNTNISRLARRRAKRHMETFEKALQYYDNFAEEQTKLPFMNIKSLTNNAQFRIFIERSITKIPKQGTFNCYGLSQAIATVPWF
ncbi:CRISPR-associated protein, Csy4 family [Psychromonas ingrahamii 37]|uniref:CRISPR-associated protein, Csy4 family n=1 Tax=Psychromonas ingrahamii (strain DSM 17664 / CCUG 51855 / 37) TaxID=357804 RepID=A1SUQ3_PSYIN|nr:type I-F CRISPR-associated endoribonuclease Cas6/Csy4 [Psychromonas ingrahamii]ABM03218.1 CRISPR-associated protein, Csy4 family [Psychromonas ingrahamii 37]